jgi:hypothetical protein
MELKALSHPLLVQGNRILRRIHKMELEVHDHRVTPRERGEKDVQNKKELKGLCIHMLTCNIFLSGNSK